MSQSEPASSKLETPPLSELDRVVGALFDPREAFADIVARPVRWWVPLVILTILGLGFLVAFDHQVGWERFFRQQNELSAQVRNLPAEQQDVVLRQQLQFGVPFAYVFAVLSWPLITIVVSGILLFVFNVLVGQQLKFRQIYASTCYGFLPAAVLYPVAAATMFLKEPADFNLQNPVASNLGIFFSMAEDPAWLVNLAGSIDIFNFWIMALLAFGISAAGRRLTWGRAFGWILGTWGLFLMIRTGIAWIFT